MEKRFGKCAKMNFLIEKVKYRYAERKPVTLFKPFIYTWFFEHLLPFSSLRILGLCQCLVERCYEGLPHLVVARLGVEGF
jgi:hypothetical protein